MGPPRIFTDSNGAVKARHDYLPFGEELFAGTGGRTIALGYGEVDEVDNLRQNFTLKERDIETELDYFGAGYYGSLQGRFTSIDPYNIVREAQITGQSNPNKAKAQLSNYLRNRQQWNRYAYVANNPMKYVDPTGQFIELTGTEEEWQKAWERIKILVGKEGAKYLSTVEMCTNGHCGTYVSYKGGDESQRSAFASTSKLNGYLADIIDSNKTVEFRIANSFTKGDGTTVFTSSLVVGGAATVGSEESSTGNTQIFVNANASAIAEQVFSQPRMANRSNPRGERLWFEEDVVDAHEFGHAYANAIESMPLRNSSATYGRSVEFENLQRDTYPHRRNVRRAIE